MAKKEFDIDIYISEICKEAGVDPDDDVFEGSKYSDEGLFLSYSDLMMSVITSNWDPAYNKDAIKILNDESKFNKFILKADIQSGIPPRFLLANYLQFAKKLFKYGIFISNLKHAFFMEMQLKLISDSFSSVLLFGELGVGKKSTVELIHRESDRSDFPFETIDCSGYSDEELCSIVFGSIYSSNEEIKTGIVHTAEKGTLYLEDLHESKILFQSKLIRLLRDGTYSKVGSRESLKSKIRIIGSAIILDEKSKNQNLYGKPGLGLSFSEPTIYLPAIRFVRSNIPLLIYLYLQKAKHKFNIDEDIIIKIPFAILKHWITQENWPDNLYYFQYYIDTILRWHINLNDVNLEQLFPECINWFDIFFPYFSNSTSYNNIKKLINEATALANDEAKTISDDIVQYMDSSRYIEVFSLEPHELFNSPLLLPLLYYYDIENKKEGIQYSAYKDISPFQVELGFGELLDLTKSTDKTIIDTDGIPPNSTFLKEKMGLKINIKKLIAEVYENSDDYPKFKYVPIDGSEIKELKFSQDVRAEKSFLVFLIYEKFKTNKDGSPNTAKWGINWLANMDEDFQPYINVCRWFGYGDEDKGKNQPGWRYSMTNASSTNSKLKEVFEENNISRELITLEKTKRKGSIYHLHKDLEAEIIIK